MMISIKKLVSGTRRRMEDVNMNIDLTYICHNRIIVMSYPSSGFESSYRNHYTDVSQNQNPNVHHYNLTLYLGREIFEY